MAKASNKAPAGAQEVALDAQDNGGQDGAQPVSKAAESVYSVTDLAGAARTRFKVPPEVVTAALKMASKNRATPAEAQRIIKDFMKREVK